MDLRVERTRALLVQAFSELMEEKPYASISVSELCERAMIRRTTFYDHFADKQDFFRFYIGSIRKELSDGAPEVDDAEGFLAYASWMTEAFIDAMSSRKGAVSKVRLEGSASSLAYIMGQEIAKEIEPVANRLLVRRGDPEGMAQERAHVFATFYSHGLMGVMMDWLENEEGTEKRSLMRRYDETVLPLVKTFFD